jgi:HEAT repeat protein
MQAGMATKRALGAVLGVVLAACAAPPPARYEPGPLTAAQTAQLKAAEAAYRSASPDYPKLRDAIAQDAAACGWLVRMLVRDVFTAREGRPLGEDTEFLRAAAKLADPVEQRAVAELKALGAAAVPTLVGDLLQHDQPQPRELGVELLGEVGQPAKAALLPLAKEGPNKQRRAAIRALGRIGFDAEGFALAQALATGDGDFTVRADALRSLRGGGAAAQALLIERLRGDGDAYVRRVAAETLTDFPTTASATALADFLDASEKAGDRDSRRVAQRALCEMAGVRAARPAAEWRSWAAGVDARAAKPSAETAR